MVGYGMAYGFRHDVVPVAGGVTVGGAQVVATNLADAQGALGKPMLPQIFATNGELINGVSGGVATAIGTLAATGHGGRYLSTHEGARVATLAYGLTALVAGYLIPGIIRVSQGKSFRATGRFAYIPSSAPLPQQPPVYGGTAPASYGSGSTSQANAQVLRRLFASPY